MLVFSECTKKSPWSVGYSLDSAGAKFSPLKRFSSACEQRGPHLSVSNHKRYIQDIHHSVHLNHKSIAKTTRYSKNITLRIQKTCQCSVPVSIPKIPTQHTPCLDLICSRKICSFDSTCQSRCFVQKHGVNRALRGCQCVPRGALSYQSFEACARLCKHGSYVTQLVQLRVGT